MIDVKPNKDLALESSTLRFRSLKSNSYRHIYTFIGLQEYLRRTSIHEYTHVFMQT